MHWKSALVVFVFLCPVPVLSSKDLALNKVATQSCIFGSFNAGRAVDGVAGTDVTGGHCSHTATPNHREAWWKVDLGQIYRIHIINITYRHDYTYRLSGYYLYVTNDTDMTRSNGSVDEIRGHLCYHDVGPGLPSYHQSRTCDVNGRYVIIYNKRPADYVPQPVPMYYSYTDAVIELCEVQVYGCPVTRFGHLCETTCHCDVGGCNQDNGICDVDGCQSGWKGNTCSVCSDPNRFGANCEFTCHCKSGGCDPGTGVCTHPECQDGWKGPNCFVKTNNLALNKGASQSSHNVDGHSDAANAIDGYPTTCSHTYPRGYLQAWWQVDLGKTYRIHTINLIFTQQHRQIIRGYSIKVSNGSIGTRIEHLCYQDTTTGSSAVPPYNQSHPCSINGQYVIVYNERFGRLSTELDPFYSRNDAIVDLCDVQVLGCPSTRFGDNCLSTCHCAAYGCHSDTGECDVTGCQPDWAGHSCSECDASHFGSNCKQECHCQTGGCDNTVGTCSSSGCQAGWTGTACNQACNDTHFGPDCIHTCHCTTSGCNRTDGTCTFAGCQSGWRGVACDQACDANHFGPNCKPECHCQTGGCDNTDGTCDYSGCQAGWAGTACNQECDSPFFGHNCLRKCHCEYPGCDHVNGSCHITGCNKGWTGSSCSQADKGSNDNQLTIGIIIGIVPTLLIIAVVAIVVIMVIRHKRKEVQSDPVEYNNVAHSPDIRHVPMDYDVLHASDIDTNKNVYETISS